MQLPTQQSSIIVAVAVPVPLRQSFEFLLPVNAGITAVGARVKVPFGSRNLIGVVVDIKNSSEYPINKLREVQEVLDESSLFDAPLWETLQWIARYYLAPIGEVLDAALPVVLRQGDSESPNNKKTWSLSEHGRVSPLDELSRAPLQLAIIKRFMQSSVLVSEDFKDTSSGWRQAIKTLIQKGWVEELSDHPKLAHRTQRLDKPLSLNEQQLGAVTTLTHALNDNSFSVNLLHGVTGSGKTEVYFAVMDRVLHSGKQVLLLVPEIGLTPQLIQRIKARFTEPVVMMHSGLNDTERHLAWWHARQGNARIIVGTRSAVFSNLANLGLIVIDEEHDGSFKQQDGVRYQARDVAIYRAKKHAIPIVLGSATPSLESYLNAIKGRYNLLRLTQRATKARLSSLRFKFDPAQAHKSTSMPPLRL